MAGVDDNVAIIGDWVPPSPSPRTFFSSLLGEDMCSRSMSETPVNSRKENLFSGSQELTHTAKSNLNNMALYHISGDNIMQPSSLSDQRPCFRGGLLDRRAGFNAPRLNTENIRSSEVSQNSDIGSRYLTIPPGLSPTSLLESPVFVSNSLAQQSPTTGKLAFMSNGDIQSNASVSVAHDKSKDGDFDDMDTQFAFKPAAESGSSFSFGVLSNMTPVTLPQQSLPQCEVSAQPEKSHKSQSTNTIQTQDRKGLHLLADFSDLPTEKDYKVNTSDIVGSSGGLSPPFDEQPDEEGDPRGCGDSMIHGAGGTPSEDGYNWRKYGQKQVKGSEYPRSYYKCTHPNCQVKKKVERSHEGHITEIIYKGAHNHPKPPPNRLLTMGSFSPLTDMQFYNSDQTGAPSGPDVDPGWVSAKKGAIAGKVDWKHENHEVTSSASGGPENCSQPSLQAPNGVQVVSMDAVDVSSTFSNEDEDDRGTHGSVSLGNDGEGDESESKRRKLESYATDMSGASRAIREPRVVVQTTSEVDILDDGYRWRKYGQKVVKGNPNPRSYYKCTNAGCSVRKHVERASHDLKSVITTYEGKHNHDVPAARSSSHLNAGASNIAPAQGAAAAAIQANVLRPESSQVHNSIRRYENPALGSFNLAGRQHVGSAHGFFGMNQNGLATNMAMGGFASTRPTVPVMPLHQYLGQPRPANEMSFVLPKGEPNSENIPGPTLNLSTGSSMYPQMMSRLPLGPQM